MEGTSAALTVRALRKSYGATDAVKGIDLTVERGQVYGLLGPNGSGKTTTLSCALGLLPATSGECHVLGVPAKKLHRTLGRVGCVFDVPAILRAHSVAENLQYQSRLRAKVARDGRSIADALERVGLGGFEKRRAGGLSLGQEKRLAIAGAIMGKPELLVLDEPLSGLDPMGVRGMLALLMELREDGQTLVVSSHRLHEMQQVLTHAAVILDGELVKEAPIEEYLGREGSWHVRVRDAELAKRGLVESILHGQATLGPANEEGLHVVHAPGVDGETLCEALASSGAGVTHFSEARVGLQASFEAVVDERRKGATA